ncbi:spermidine synthase [Corynebacterium rouxii]|uniref:Fused MFS/spermidine synthase n=1 Tax=Corynebacterium rouxii TaxID=2719119 RepID=A0ABU3PM05_9CORY|nr:fused MFS/spermidine synthase [Corynebacterium rouxii]MDT9408685.1 fused MFS/spermidine synthase [Corynebacterium rouxii]MDT9410865.1 fused MFS/spermidine synthase [Corynebacterium rouxii]
MGRKRTNNSQAQGHGPVPGVYPTSTGEVELRADSFLPHAFEVYVNGVPSSHIAQDPEQLEYEYMRWIAAIVDWFVAAHSNPQKLRVTHLGGGACTLARYFCHRFPDARNTVVELDATLATLVREWFDLPRSPQLKIRVGDAWDVTQTFVPSSRDVIIRDVFAGSTTPERLTTVNFFERCHQALSPGGLYVANCGDHRDLHIAKAEIQGLREVFRHVACIADPAMLKGRRYGNIILIATDSELPTNQEQQALTRLLLGGGVPAQFKDNQWTKNFSSSSTARRV